LAKRFHMLSTGLEPMTFALSERRATNCATRALCHSQHFMIYVSVCYPPIVRYAGEHCLLTPTVYNVTCNMPRSHEDNRAHTGHPPPQSLWGGDRTHPPAPIAASHWAHRPRPPSDKPKEGPCGALRGQHHARPDPPADHSALTPASDPADSTLIRYPPRMGAFAPPPDARAGAVGARRGLGVAGRRSRRLGVGGGRRGARS
jgi:hypothetical protein